MNWKLPIGFCLALVCIGCRPSRPVLRLYNWADYIKPDLIARFEQETGCRIVVETFDSNTAMLSRLQQRGARYDLVFPSDYFLPALKTQGLLQPIRHRLVPNLKHLDPDRLKMVTDRACVYSVPYMLSSTGIGFRRSLLPNAQPSWKLFDRPEAKGRMTLLDDARETIGAALKLLGYSLNTTRDAELSAARDVVIRWKKNAARLDNDQYRNGITTGELALAHGYSGDLLRAAADNKDVVCASPVEGAALSCDLIVIPQNARQVELAHRFINFLHDPEVAAENMEFVMFLCPNKPAYERLSPEVQSNSAVFLPLEILVRSEVIRDLGPDNAKYERLWEQIKSN